ncbi:MAG: endolytic transglycosylase MltG [Parcubacteria group bacterium]|nr:endolytic transglycosylase MltG [Parcubacteria group bacterium]
MEKLILQVKNWFYILENWIKSVYSQIRQGCFELDKNKCLGSKKCRTTAFCITGLVLFLLIFYLFLYRAPTNFPNYTLFTVNKGDTLSQVADSLYENHLIRSPFWFRNFVILADREKGLIAGDYVFGVPQSVFKIANRITVANYGLDFIKVTIPEGMNKFQMAQIFEEKFSKFDLKDFISNAKEGYLFPDTYLFLPNSRSPQVLSLMRNNFDKKIQSVESEIAEFKKPLDDVIIMASILEEEARKTDTRRTIAGILWKRLSIGMPLQVDSTFQYINGKNTYQLTIDDLKIDSPYNTYRHKGLPVTPISNPGLDSILAAVTPIETPYFYFLSDRKGNMYYATTFEEHKKNKVLYLN